MITPHGIATYKDFLYNISADISSSSNLRTLAIAAGWDQSSKVICTVKSGFKIYTAANAASGLTIDGSFPKGVQLNIESGAGVYGGPGFGGTGGNTSSSGNSASNGGTALIVSVPVTIDNLGTIAGGGPGGGGGGGGQDGVNANGLTGGDGGKGQYATTARTTGATGQSGGGGGYAGNGGDGGTYNGTGAADDGTGGAGTYPGNTFTTGGGSKGNPGYSRTGDSNITWVNTGTRYGSFS